jgi:hypothetical protein
MTRGEEKRERKEKIEAEPNYRPLKELVLVG